jgi:hypothetical protein
VAAAEAFFGKPESRIGQRTLVLTATPSHTQLGDVANILSYFTDLSVCAHPARVIQGANTNEAEILEATLKKRG